MKGIAFPWYCYNLSIFTACIFSLAANAAIHSITSDEDALLALKDHITHDPYQILAKNWSAGSSICDWIGITCGKRHHRVTALDISSMNLTGTIPPQLGNLSFLVSINLYGNNFIGDMPMELAHLSRLKLLNFSINALTGEIPTSIGTLDQLEYLSLNNNSFTGSIPSSISNISNLKVLTLHQNQLSGSIPFEIFNISTLEGLFLAFNSLSGSLPISICRHLQKLEQIVFWNNFLDGPLPSDLSYCSQLRRIDFSHNNFSGSVPEEFWNMKMLELAYFQYNSFEGTIPKDMSNLTNLRGLDLSTNRLTGVIPKEIGDLTSLVYLALQDNNLRGVIPKEIGNLTLLRYLYIADNNLRGTMPEEVGNLVNLEILYLSLNGMSGSVPEGLFNISTLIELDLSGNYFSGTLPQTMGFGLPKLEFFNFHRNRLSGFIPLFLSNSSSVSLIDLTENYFTGVIPHFLGNLKFLESLELAENMFTTDFSSSFELVFLISLSNCRYLTELTFSNNPLNGILPTSIGNLSKSIEYMDGSGCGISGEIPASIANLTNLVALEFEHNHFTSSLPTSIASLQKLQALGLQYNKLSGSLSCNLFGLKSLSELYLYKNLFSGAIPGCIENSTSLRKVDLSGNNFSYSIPMSLWHMKDLLELNISSNFLNGSLPLQMGNLKVLTSLDLSMNNLSGDIPNAVGLLQSLVNFSLANNLLEGSIPNSVGSMVSLQYLDLSKNNLSGSIPATLEKLEDLMFFNVSHNHLDGLIPSGGPFKNLTHESFIFNEALCGEKRFHVPPCPVKSTKKSWIKSPKHELILCSSLVAASISAITLVVVYIIIFQRKSKVRKSDEQLLVTSKDRISFYELQHATNGYSERNLLGQGSFGTVYKAMLRDGRVVAVKVFNVQSEGGLKSFDVECEILRNLRHRNLTQVISSCSNLDFKAIVLEYMPNGSLDNWLHSENHFLSFTERLNIMIDVASALQYLHSGYPTPVVHADLKPSNILLDQSMVAHVSDFGIAKMLEGSSITYTNTLATFGYIAPEFGSEGLVSTECDIYSFGIMLIEVFTRKRPCDEMFNENLTMPVLVNNYSTMNALDEIIDDGLLNTDEDENFALMMDCLVVVMNVALKCTKTFPRERSDIGEILATLNKIKLKL